MCETLLGVAVMSESGRFPCPKDCGCTYEPVCGFNPCEEEHPNHMFRTFHNKCELENTICDGPGHCKYYIAYYVLGEWLVSMLQGLRLQSVWWGAPKSHVLCFRRQTWAGKYYLRRALVTVSTVNSYVFGEWLWVVMCCMDCYVPLLMKVEKQ